MNRHAKTSLTDALMGLALVLALCVPAISGASPGKGNGSFSPRALDAIDSLGNDKVELGIVNGQAISVPARDGVPCITFSAELSRQL